MSHNNELLNVVRQVIEYGSCNNVDKLTFTWQTHVNFNHAITITYKGNKYDETSSDDCRDCDGDGKSEFLS